MTQEEQRLILKLTMNELTEEEFLRLYPLGGLDPSTYLLSSLKASSTADDLAYTMYFGFHFGFPASAVPLLNSLLPCDWHKSHEDIVSVLEDYHDPSSVDALWQAATADYEYLAYDEVRALTKKACWALSKIGTSAAKDKLKLLALSSNPVIKKAAEKQLARLEIPKSVSVLVALLVEKNYKGVEAYTCSSRMTAAEIDAALSSYKRRLVNPPVEGWNLLEIVAVQNVVPQRWSVVVPLWTAEEGRSDLSIECTATQKGDSVQLELDDIHVL